MILKRIKEEFEITIATANQYIGLEIDRDHKGIRICQENYVEKILKQFNMLECNQVGTPSTPEIRDQKESTVAPYSEAVGALMFLANISRLDIAFATGKVAKKSASPTQGDWMEVKRILRYLKGTQDIGITYPREGSLELVGYCDADYAGDTETRKSTTRLIITLNGSP